ncbi:diaminobutyrate acetyltransferase [Catenovulum sp. 2E275]|uniref:diaminobutyrate acetyltransferase n=1 Tax=Catenovulum sp. 2E275 TaxID=2980497 RepID=UPI0021CFD899|nr:diaminobutyrate acetyltransferase [Catenovulum sp. 2E275]MCU4674407.1 diaminobutyrate acetyltransferase [Catenovulum sp. 2E275]
MGELILINNQSKVVTPATENKGEISFRHPVSEDGFAINQLIAACPPLDTNSAYCNLLQCSHFSDTCVVAELNGEIVGWVSAYIEPKQPQNLFIWQMAVSEKARGCALAQRMLMFLLAQRQCSATRFVETTITADNLASRRVFQKLAEGFETDCVESVMFSKEVHFGGKHNTEYLFTIGPIAAEQLQKIKL